jgi:carbamoylphosphate synthase large subunit
MKSVGEAMAIGRTFQQAFAKVAQPRADIATSSTPSTRHPVALSARRAIRRRSALRKARGQ